MKTQAEIVEELKNRIISEKQDMEESRKFGCNCPGFNQALGAFDALNHLLQWIQEND